MSSNQSYTIVKGTKDWITIDCAGVLDVNQTLTGTPTVSISPSTNAPTLSSPQVNTEILQGINGRNVPVGEAVQVFVSTTSADSQPYTITVTAQKTGSSSPQRVAKITLTVAPA